MIRIVSRCLPSVIWTRLSFPSPQSPTFDTWHRIPGTQHLFLLVPSPGLWTEATQTLEKPAHRKCALAIGHRCMLTVRVEGYNLSLGGEE